MDETKQAILTAAGKLFASQGYMHTTLADIATAAKIPLPALQSHFADKNTMLKLLLEQHSPYDAIQRLLRQLKSDSAEELVREALRGLIGIFNEHQQFSDLALIDVQVNGGAFLAEMFGDLATEGASFINRLSTMPDIRPVSSIMLGRAFASLLLGFVATQQFAPQTARFAMRIFPEKAWIDGVADIFLYGILEDDE